MPSKIDFIMGKVVEKVGLILFSQKIGRLYVEKKAEKKEKNPT